MDPYEAMAKGAARYKRIVETCNPEYYNDDLWWFIQAFQRGCEAKNNRTILNIQLGHIIGALVERGYTTLKEERRLVREHIRLIDKVYAELDDD